MQASTLGWEQEAVPRGKKGEHGHQGESEELEGALRKKGLWH